MQQDRFGAIQIARAVAALMVVVAHSLLSLVEKASLTPDVGATANAFGYSGVAIFFVISGFVMTHTTVDSFGQVESSIQFLARRIWRIVPLYWLATTIYAAKLSLEGNAPGATDLVRSFLFIPYFNDEGALRPVYGLGWTLNFEMYFYLAFSIALLLPRRLGLLAIAVVLGFLPVASLLGLLPPSTEPLLAQSMDHMVLYFIAGIAIYQVLRQVGGLGIFATPSNSRFVQLLLLAGDSSYSIYLTHSFVLGPAARIWGMLSLPPILSVVFVAAMIVVTTALGIAVHIWVEKPVLRVLKVLLPKRSSAVRVTTGS